MGMAKPDGHRVRMGIVIRKDEATETCQVHRTDNKNDGDPEEDFPETRALGGRCRGRGGESWKLSETVIPSGTVVKIINCPQRHNGTVVAVPS